MKAIIMAGGYGTRLQPLTLRTPKCVLPTGDKTTILLMLEQLKTAKIKEVIISLNKNQVKVKDFIEYHKLGMNIKYIFEDSEEDKDKLGAIGALSYVVEKFGADDYFVLGADNYTYGLNYEDMLNEHNKTKSDVTIALYELTDISKVSLFGIGVVDKENRIISFQEKPKTEEALSMLASTFIYIISKNFLQKELPSYVNKEKAAGRKPDIIGDLWAHYVKKIRIHGYVFSGYWGDVGSPLFYVEINHKALDQIERKIDKNVKLGKNAKISGKVIIEKDCEISDEAVIIGPCIISQGSKIGQGTIIGPYTTLLQKSQIGKNNIISGSVIFENTKTTDNVKITRALIDGSCTINENTRVEEQAMIGYSCEIGQNSQIFYNTKLWPFLNADKNSVVNGKIFYKMHNMIHEKKIKESCYWEE